MKISTKGRYGLRAMVDLSTHASKKHSSIKEIAERQNISVRYLEQVFSILKNAGYISSIKGTKGGYTLSKSAEQISVGDILRVLEGDLSIINQKEIKDKEMETFLNKYLWDKIDEKILNTVNNTSLKDLEGEC